MTLFKFAHPDDLPCAFGFAARLLRLRDRSYSAMLRGDGATNSVCMLRHCYIGDCYQSVFLSLSLLRMDPQAAVGPNSNHNGAMKTIGSMGSIASVASVASVESAGSGRVGNPAEIWAGSTVVNQGNTIANQGNTIANQGNTIVNQGTGNGTSSLTTGSSSSCSASCSSSSACSASVCFVWNLLPLLACSCTDASRDTM